VGWQPETQPKVKPPVEKTKGTETMLRLIDADALYMELVKMNDFGELTAKKAIRVVKNAPTIDAEPHWIPCSEKFPEIDRSVLVQLSDEFIDPIQIMTLNISKLDGDFYYSWRTQEMGIDFDMDDVVAWMPLPKPYEAANHE
jgi:hypothetical protein